MSVSRFFFARVDMHPAALFRIASGILFLAMLLAAFPNWDLYFSRNGILSLNDPLGRFYVDPWNLFALSEGLPTRAIWLLGFLSGLLYTAGWYTRISTVAVYLVLDSMMLRNWMIIHGEDLVLRMLFFYACFASLGDHLSVDAFLRKKAGKPTPEPRSAWPLRLMQVNFVLIYAFSLPMKLASDRGWWNGEIMYRVLINATWSRWPWPSIAAIPVVSAFLTFMSLVIEFSIPTLIWFPKLRRLIIFNGMLLHATIAVVLQNVSFFSLAMDCGFLLFLFPEDSRAIVHQAARLVQGRRQTVRA